MKNKLNSLSNIKLIVSDVDGVLTDGKIYFDAEGREMKVFNNRDGMRSDIWIKGGKKLLCFTGRKSEGVKRRVTELSADLLFKEDLKLDLFEYVMAKYSLKPEEVAYIGDDLSDLYYMSRAGISIAPADASYENKGIAHVVTKTEGGQGVLAEAIELIMNAQGKWDNALKLYKDKFTL